MTSSNHSGDAAHLLATARKAHQQGDNARALRAVTDALAQYDDAVAWDLKGDILLGLGQFPAAAEAYQEAVDRDPGNATYNHDLGRALLQAERPAEAERVLNSAVALKHGAWDALCDLGTAQLAQGRAAAAAGSFAAAVAAKPDAPLAHFNHGTALLDLGSLDAAAGAFRAALQVAPHFRPALMSLANLLCDRGKREEGQRLFAAAKALDANDPVFDQTTALVDLRYGNLREGFARYEARFSPTHYGLPVRPFTAPRWNGESLAGRSILIWTEQGLGEEILSASMFPEIVATAASCTIECSARLVPAFQRSFPRAHVVARQEPPDPAALNVFDFQIPALSLGTFVRPTFAHFPAQAGYLRADPALTEHLRQKYREAQPGTRIVGISWESASRHGNRKRVPLELWRPILDIPNTTFVSLQYGVRPDSPLLKDIGKQVMIDGDIDALKSLDASAAQVAAMDLVITASNTTAHLAGAQNVPVWTLLTEGPGCFWYWFRDRADSPWYPSMRLMRQTAPGDWQTVIAGVAQALVELPPQGRL